MFKKLFCCLSTLSCIFYAGISLSQPLETACEKGTSGCVISFVAPLPIIDTLMGCGDTQDLSYTIQNNAVVDVTVVDAIEFLSTNTSLATVTITGGSCGVSPFVLPAGEQCTIDVQIATPACFVQKEDKLAITELRAALVLFPSTSQGPQQAIRSIIAVDTADTPVARQRAYIANNVTSGPYLNTISICPVDQSDGTLQICTTFTDSNATFNIPEDIIVNDTVTMAYVANQGNDTISYCPVNPDGSLAPCTGAVSAAVNLAFSGIRLTPDNSKLYVTSYSSNKVAECTVGGGGILTGCAQITVATISGPNGRMAFNPAGSLAYIPNYSSSSVSVCDTLTFGSCTTSSALDKSLGLDMNTAATHIYVATLGNTISTCKINGLTLDPCTSTGGFSFADDVNNIYMHNMIGGTEYGYVPNDGDETISVCTIDGLGVISCNPGVSGNFDDPTSVWIATLP